MNNKFIKAIAVEVLQNETIENNIIYGKIDNNQFKKTGKFDVNQIYHCYIGEDFYIGNLRNNKRHGQGKCEYLNGAVYTGQFANDLPNGKGILCFADGTKYEGYFEDFEYSGKGKYIFSDGETIEGYFKFSEIDGEGIYNYSNGDIYEGSFKYNLPHGYGILKTKDYSYEGNFNRGKKDGIFRVNGKSISKNVKYRNDVKINKMCVIS